MEVNNIRLLSSGIWASIRSVTENWNATSDIQWPNEDYCGSAITYVLSLLHLYNVRPTENGDFINPPSHVLFLCIQIPPHALTHIDLNEYAYIYLQECTQVCSVTVFMTTGFKVITVWICDCNYKANLNYDKIIFPPYSFPLAELRVQYLWYNEHAFIISTDNAFPSPQLSIFIHICCFKIISSWITLIAPVQLTGYQRMCHILWR